MTKVTLEKTEIMYIKKVLGKQKPEPKNQTMNTLGMFGNKTVLSTMFVVTKKENIEELYKTINQIFKDNDEVVGGTSILPNDSGLSVKILSNSSEDNKTTVYNISQIIRRQFF